MDERTVLAGSEERMKKIIEGYQKTLASTRAGRATPTLLEKVASTTTGCRLRLANCQHRGSASQNPSHPAWDKKMIGPIEKAIQKADLGAMPVNDANLVRLTIPALTGERRQEIVKSIRKQSEAEKVSVRNVRRDYIEEIKKAEKDKEISEDESRRIQDKVQKLTDKYIKLIDELTAAKEKEVLEV
jgi:ribosome recycling factor